jgi:hypothetical protein
MLAKNKSEFKKMLFTAPALVVLVLAAASPFRAELQKPPQVREVVGLPPGPMAEKAATACTECHETRIILQQRLSKTAWTKEVDKMIKWGALVDPKDHDSLIDYFSTNFGPDQPPYEPQRTSSGKMSSAKNTAAKK